MVNHVTWLMVPGGLIFRNCSKAEMSWDFRNVLGIVINNKKTPVSSSRMGQNTLLKTVETGSS